MSLESEMQAALATFVVEGGELVEELETGLLALESDGGTTEVVNAIFRAAHTIKGSSGLFGLDHLVAFTHVVESVLDRLRTGEITADAALVGALLPCCDHLAGLLAGVARGEKSQSERQTAQGEALHRGLRPYLSGAAAGPAGSDTEPQDGVRNVHLSLRFGRDCLRGGLDPLSFMAYLSTLGEIVEVTPVDGLLPAVERLDPESCYLAFQVTLRTDAPHAAIVEVFEFVQEDSDIVVLEPDSTPSLYRGLIDAFGEHGPVVEQCLVRTGAVDAGVLAALRTQPAAPIPGPGPESSAGPESQAGPAAPPETVDLRSEPVDRPGPPVGAGEARGRETSSIRIDASRLDRLIDVVGELVIAGAGAGVQASAIHDEALSIALGEVMRLVEEVRDSALQLRMVPIGATFNRFQRVVHDVGADLGKDVALVISGGDTEVDKALVEQIGDPLTHLVRNSMDHGIESAQVRAERGKPAQGTLRLNAHHDSGSIVIEVSDDGGGIDRDRVLAKAVERGLVEPGAALSDQDVYALIFEPGFSTSDVVSNLSGRGVGMDVVRRNVTALRGTIDVDSTFGVGTTMRIRLPLTLAIIDGFLVGVGGATFVVPLDRVIECVELPVRSAGRDCIDLRGEVLPFIRLRSLFSIGGDRPRRENVVVVEYAGLKVGLVVDTLMGEFQTVIKPLGRLFARVQGIGGSTILGNGDVALIIDVSMLVRHFGDRQSAAQGALVGSA